MSGAAVSRIKQIVLVAGVAEVLLTVSVQGSRHAIGDIAGVALLASQNFLPFILYYNVIKSRIGSTLTGVTIIAITAWFHGSYLLSKSSTSALAFVVTSFLSLAAVMIGWGLESISSAFFRRRQGRTAS